MVDRASRTERRCTALANSGKRCTVTGGLAVDSEGRVRCVWHNDLAKPRATRMRRKGAATRRRQRSQRAVIPNAPRTLDDAIAFSSWLTTAVLEGNVTPKAAQESSRALANFTRGLKERDLANRMAALERGMKALKKGDR